jgi:hypothetical protein
MFEVRQKIYPLVSGAIVFWRLRDSAWYVKQFDDIVALNDLSPENQRLIFESLKADVRQALLKDYDGDCKEPKSDPKKPCRVVPGDCGTTKHVIIHPRKVKYQEQLIGRTVLGEDGEWVLLTKDNLAEYIQQEQLGLRSAITCALPEGVCAVCCGPVPLDEPYSISTVLERLKSLSTPGRVGELEVDATKDDAVTMQKRFTDVLLETNRKHMEIENKVRFLTQVTRVDAPMEFLKQLYAEGTNQGWCVELMPWLDKPE